MVAVVVPIGEPGHVASRCAALNRRKAELIAGASSLL